MKKGRKSKSVEHLETLIEWAGGAKQFETLTEIRVGDQNHYLSGAKRVSMNRLRRAAEQVFGTPPAFVPVVERQALPTNLATLPTALKGSPGVYALFSSSGSLLYFGKASDLLTEIKQTLGRPTPAVLVNGTAKEVYTFRDLSSYYSAYHVLRGDKDFRHDLESLAIRCVRRDTLNGVGGHFKRTK